MREEVVDYVRGKSGRTEVPRKHRVAWLGIGMSKFYDWQARYGKLNEHNALTPRDHWLAEYTAELLSVLGRLVQLEPDQVKLLEAICAGPLLTTLPEALEAPAEKAAKKSVSNQYAPAPLNKKRK